jgi:hypothetical protein
MHNRTLCREHYNKSRSGNLGVEIPEGKEFVWNDKTYIVTKNGTVFSAITYRFITPSIMKNGYVMYSFGSNAAYSRKQFYVHRLVAYCYGILDDLDSNLCVDHIDRNKQNNNLDNLRVVSYSENEISKCVATKGLLYAHKDGVKYGPYNSVKEMNDALGLKSKVDSIYSQLSKGYHKVSGYTFSREGT